MESRKPTADEQSEYDAPIDVEHDGTSMVPSSGPAYPMATGPAPGSTHGISTIDFDKKELDVLGRKPAVEEIEVRDDGVPYVPGGIYRQRLIEAFGPGRWALRQESAVVHNKDIGEVCYDGSLWVRGQYVARATGGCKLRVGGGSGMTWSDAIEGAKTDCLKRCCKDLGITLELWSPEFVRSFLADHAEPYLGTGWDAKLRKEVPRIKWKRQGVALTGKALDSATGILGAFPLGFSPDTPIPDGPLAGHPLREAPDSLLPNLASKASTPEWRLTAKAEILRRLMEAKAAAPDPDKQIKPAAPSVSEALDTSSHEDGETQQA
jgi:hypothetical protein